MSLNTGKSNFPVICRLIIIGLLIIIVAEILNRIFTSPFDFDEGVGLILSHMFYATGRYASYEALFDPVITVGPTVYLPTALTFIFGNVFLPRIIILTYSSLLIFIVVSKFLHENISRILFLSLLCFMPYYFYFSAHVLGEIPAIFFSLIGLYFLSDRKYFLSGTFLGLAILTKNILFLSLIPALYLLFLDRRELTFPKLVSFVTPFILIGSVWEIYKLYSFNFQFSRYFDNLIQFIRYHKTITGMHPEYFSGRIQMLGGTFGFNGFLVFLSLLSISIYSFFKSNSSLLKSISLFVLVYLAYFFILGSTVWYRHFFPTVVFFVIILAGIFGSVHLSKLSLIPIVLALLVSFIFSSVNPNYLYQQNLLPLFDRTGKTFLCQSEILKQQLATAGYISSQVRYEKISGVVWYNAPEISYLAGEQIYRLPEDQDVSYLISHPFGRLLVPSVDARISKYPGKQTVLDTPLYKIYKKND